MINSINLKFIFTRKNNKPKSLTNLIFFSISLLIPISSFAQIADYKKYSDISGSDYYNFNILEDIKYGVGKTNYQKQNESGSYQTISQLDLELDLFVPQTSLNEGKRAVVIMIPSGGRTGCRSVTIKYLANGSVDTANGCDQQTIVSGGRVTQEGANYNHYNNAIASQYAQRGLIVASINTRYTYQHTQFNVSGSNRWYRTADGTKTGSNPATVLNTVSAHLEFLVTDVKRAVRWLTANADTYNIDPNYIFIDGGSGGAKMASLAAFTNKTQLIVDDPADIDVAFETANNNWAIRNSTPGIKGAILKKADPNGTYNMSLMDTKDAHTDSFMFWAGTADSAIIHGMSEIMEEKCEILQTCSTQLYSLPNKTHYTASAASYPHTKSGNKTTSAHIYDFIVNTIDKDTKNLPVISISQSSVSFNESVGTAQINIVRTGDTSSAITFTASADQVRDVTLENGTQGSFDSITKYVAKSSNSDGLVMYNQSTGYAYEDAFSGTLRNPNDRTVTHTSGPGAGQFTEISSADSEYHNIDFTGKTQILTMAAGQTSINFSVPIFNDSLIEDNECFTVRLLNAYGAEINNSVENITILDNDNSNPQTHALCSNSDSSSVVPITPTVSFSSSAKSINEGNSTSLTIVSNRVSSNNISVAYKTTSGSASTADFKWVSSVATIPAGQTSVDISIQTTQDSILESNENFTVDITGVTGGTANIGSVSSYILTIIDDDVQPVISLSPSTVTLNEGSSRALTLSSDRVVTQDITIQYQTVAGSATASDFTAVFRNAVIPAGSSSVNVTISTIDDSLFEENESFVVRLNQIVSGDASLGNQKTSQISIIDNDSLPVISIEPDAVSVSEGNTFVLTIESNQSSSQPISVEYQTSQGTATINDFSWVRESATIPAGQTSVDITIETIDDLSDEPNETFIVFLREITSGNAELGNPIVTNITIVDNDVTPTISLTPSYRSVNEGDNTVLTISANRAIPGAISVEYQTTTGTALTSDFKWVRRTAVIPFGQTSVDITLETTEDQLDEPNETFLVSLIGITGEGNIGSSDTTQITIVDDDAASTQPVITLSPLNKSTQEGSFIGLTISANKVVSSAVSVEYITRPITATSGVDFVWARETAIIPAGSSSVDITIETREDSLVESDQTFKVDLIDIIGNAQLGSENSSVITILDDDTANSTPTISITPTTKTVAEGSYLGLTITANQNVSSPVTIEYTTRAITATSGADYTWVRSNVTIPTGSRSVDISIKTLDDSAVESNETFRVDLEGIVSGSATLSASDSSVITIIDDDVYAAPVITITPVNTTVSEGKWINLTIQADRVVSSDVIVEYTTRAITSTSADFVWFRKYAVIRAGSRRVEISIQTREDSITENDETFKVDLDSVSTNAELGVNASSVITILDDETPPTISFSQPLSYVDEGSNAVLTIQSDREVQNSVTVEYQTRSWTANTNDFVWVKKYATIPKEGIGVQIQIETIADDIADEPEEFRVQLNRVVSGAASIAALNSTAVWIQTPCEYRIIPLENGKAVVFCL